MCVRVRGQNGQDDGNKRNKSNAEIHGTAVKLLIGLFPVNTSLKFMTLGRDSPAQLSSLGSASHGGARALGSYFAAVSVTRPNDSRFSPSTPFSSQLHVLAVES